MARARSTKKVLTKSTKAVSGNGYTMLEDLPDGEWVVDA
jgi:hypothetical protein